MIINLLTNVCKLLNENGFSYMISGSIALNIYTIPRMTRDIDIVIELEESRVDEFVNLFPNTYYNKESIFHELKKQGIFNIIDHTTGFKIDFIFRKNTEYFNLAFSRRKKIHEFNTILWVISLEDLIIAKLIWSQQSKSDKQIDDIRNLLLNPNKDINYLTTWCKNLNLNTFNLLT